eukprot:s4205_g3.t1
MCEASTFGSSYLVHSRLSGKPRRMAFPSVGGPFVWAFVAFSSVLHFFEQYLEWRQLQKNRETTVPAEFQGVVDESKFLESQVYQKDKRLFGFVKDWVSFIYDKVQLFLITPWLWHYAVAVFGDEAEYSCTLFWLFLLQWVEKPISIPFSLYSNFVVEVRRFADSQIATSSRLYNLRICESANVRLCKSANLQIYEFARNPEFIYLPDAND